MKNNPVIVEETFHASVERVWQAITNKDQMKSWHFDLAEFKAEVGFTFQFLGGPPEKQYVHLCEVTEVIPEKKLTYSWRYEGYAGNSFVTMELFPQGDMTMLRLTHTGLETFPEETTDFARSNFEAGWNEIIHKQLKGYLEK